MMQGMFKFKGINGPVWIDLSSVNAFVAGSVSIGADFRYYSVLFHNGKVADIISNEQEIDEIVKQHRTDKPCLETLANKK